MSERNPFDRLADPAMQREGGARRLYIAMALVGLFLIILVLPPISLLGGGSDSNFTPNTGTTADGSLAVPLVPEGFEALSRLFDDLDAPKEIQGPFALTVKLDLPVADSRNLGIYTFSRGEWVRISDAELTESGDAVTGLAAEIPENLAVLRRLGTAVEISGRLAAAAQPDPQALSILTTVNPAGISPAADGSLTGAQGQAVSGDAVVVPVVRALSAESIQAVEAILASPALREAHISALLQLAQQPGNSGVELDYRDVSVARRADLVAFVSELAARLHQANRRLSLVLPAPVRNGNSWDTQAYDWDRLSALADAVKLLPEPDPSLYYETMEGVLQFLSLSVDMQRVHLVVSRNSLEKGAGEISQRTLLDALSVAAALEIRTSAPITPGTRVMVVGTNIFEDDGATGLRWDEKALAVSFSFPGVGGQRTVWLENSLSMAFRLDLARRFGLGGISVEDVSFDPRAADIWPILDAYADTLSVSLVAPNSVMLRPAWRIDAGLSEAGSEGNIVWTAPEEPGVYEVALIVSDGLIRGEQRLSLEVRAEAPDTDEEPAP